MRARIRRLSMHESDRLPRGIAADLLQPSIAAVRPLYSPGVLALSAFFGGMIAASLVFALNAQRLRRLARDAWLIVLGFAGAFAILELGALDSAQRFLLRVAALAFAGLLWLNHRHAMRAQALWRDPAKHGFWVGLGAIVVAVLLSIGWVSLRRMAGA